MRLRSLTLSIRCKMTSIFLPQSYKWAAHPEYNHYNSMSASTQRQPDPLLSDSVLEMFSMKGKTVALTGGSGGIGSEIARGLAEAGANIALW